MNSPTPTEIDRMDRLDKALFATGCVLAAEALAIKWLFFLFAWMVWLGYW